MIELAIALSLGFALALCASAAAGASLIGEALPTVTVPTVTVPTVTVPTVTLPTMTVQAGPLVVETSPRPKVEVPGVATVEAPSIAPPQAPSPPVASPSLPTIGTPVTQSPSTPSGSAGSTAGSQGTTSAHAATTAAAGPSQARAGGSGTAPSSGAGQSSSRPRAVGHPDKHAAIGPSGKPSAAALVATAPAASATPARGRSTAHSSTDKGSSGNPLNAIGRHIPFPVPVPDWSKPIILLLLALALWFAARSRLAAVRARRLEGQRASLERDLGTMQATLVPVVPERLGELSVSVAYRPADGPAAGGDFYDVLVLEPGRVAIVLGDVAGHGRSALTQAALTRYTLRAYLQAGLEPRAVLALAGSVLSEPGEMPFATVVIGIHDSTTGRLTYASAGHPPPISIGFDTSEPLTSCCSAPICCGLPTGRRQTTISVPAGGQVCFFSDGLLEARTAAGLLGRERLVEVANELEPLRAAALLQRVRDEALATPDDMVACVISAAVDAPPPVGQVEELEVDAQTLDGPHVATFLAACGVHTASVAALLARARDVVAAGGTALLRIERPHGGEATVVAMPGLSTSASTAAIEQARRSGESALALPVAR
jgi:hypothetical protein